MRGVAVGLPAVGGWRAGKGEEFDVALPVAHVGVRVGKEDALELAEHRATQALVHLLLHEQLPLLEAVRRVDPQARCEVEMLGRAALQAEPASRSLPVGTIGELLRAWPPSLGLIEDGEEGARVSKQHLVSLGGRDLVRDLGGVSLSRGAVTDTDRAVGGAIDMRERVAPPSGPAAAAKQHAVYGDDSDDEPPPL